MVKGVSRHGKAPPFSREDLPAGTRLGLAVSGGADSVALLRLALELAAHNGWALRVLHVQHGLRGEVGEQDAAFVRDLAATHALPSSIYRTEAGALAVSRRIGVEEAARLLRYGWFRALLLAGEMDAVATGHTLDDQAETVVGKLLRGAWTAGLGGIHPRVPAADLPGVENAPEGVSAGMVVRPLLGARRSDLRAWLRSLGQSWREDESNNDLQFTRNRIRHHLLPQLRSFNPQVAEQLAQISTLARADEQYWQLEVDRILPGLLLPGRPVRGGGRSTSTVPGDRSLAIEVERLQSLATALRGRVVRAIAARLGVELSFPETERVLALLTGPAGSAPRREQLTDTLRAERSPRELRFVHSEMQGPRVPAPVCVPVPGEATGFGVRLRVDLTVDANSPQPPATLRAASPADRVRLRYSSGAPKRVKKVLERLGVPVEERSGWPVLVWGGEVVWMRGAALEPTPLSSQLVITSQDAGQASESEACEGA